MPPAMVTAIIRNGITGQQRPLSYYIDALKIARVQLKALREEAVTLTGKQHLKRLLLTGIPGLAPEQKDLF